MKALWKPWKPTPKQSKAINTELRRQMSENVKCLEKNIVALMLWSVHEHCGYGKKRLLDYHKKIAPAIKNLMEYYEMTSPEDGEWICKYKLKHEVGIDVDKLESILKINYEIEGELFDGK